jgi:hypothetical protein
VALEVPPEAQYSATQAPSDDEQKPLSEPPAYEHQIEPIVYFIGHGLCLALSLAIMLVLIGGPMEPRRLITAVFMWGALGTISFKALQGVRYGCALRLYKGYLEVQALNPARVVTAAEVAYFREFHRGNSARRAIYLYLKSGQRIRLPRVHDPDNLWRCLLQDVGIEQVIS